MNLKKFLFFIPARIGSKGIKKKNLEKIGNSSLVELALNACFDLNNKDSRIIVSTDSIVIKNLVNKKGNYAPFLRPKTISSDNSKVIEAMQHCLIWLKKNYQEEYENMCMIEPTSPFRSKELIKKILKVYDPKKFTSLATVIELQDIHPIRIKKINKEGRLINYLVKEPEGIHRQDQEKLFIRNGFMYIFKTKYIKKGIQWGNKVQPFIMDYKKYSFNIDNNIDLLSARAFFQYAKKNKIKFKT